MILPKKHRGFLLESLSDDTNLERCTVHHDNFKNREGSARGTREFFLRLGVAVGMTVSSLEGGGILPPPQPVYAFSLLSADTIVDNTSTSSSSSTLPSLPVGAGSYGSSVGSNPYFSSASAARLLVEPPPSTSIRRGSSDATRRQLIQQGILQDVRLEQCFDRGIDWEQCFWYGKGVDGSGTSAAPMTLPNFNTDTSLAVKKSRIPTTKSNIPTW